MHFNPILKEEINQFGDDSEKQFGSKIMKFYKKAQHVANWICYNQNDYSQECVPDSHVTLNMVEDMNVKV